MTEYAKINTDGTIETIIVSSAEHIATRKGKWVECTTNPHARTDGTYHKILKKFIVPKPHRTWILDKRGNWNPPTPKPEQDPQLYEWSNIDNNWIVKKIKKLEFR